MREIHTQALLARYPRLLSELHAQSFQCGDGWFSLIDRLLAIIEMECQRLAINKRWSKSLPTVRIITEKHGTLRVHVYSENRTIERAVSAAEHESTRICEYCGAPGTMSDRGWLRVACDAHKGQLCPD